MYVASIIIKNESIKDINSFLETDKEYLEIESDMNNIGISTIISDFSNEYKNKVIILQGIMYYKIPEGKSKSITIKREIKWCQEIGIPIYGKDIIGLYEEFDDITIPASNTWDETAGHYVPDISKFSKRNTYYVDNTGNIVGRIDRISKPENWYNYANKEWANIVTVNGNAVAYWVWIPRYEYKVKTDEQGNSMQKTDIKFITTDAKADEGYEIPESFTFGDKELTGFWTSKYKISEINIDGFVIDLSNGNAIIQKMLEAGIYKIFVDGIYEGETDLSQNTYQIKAELTKDVYHSVMIVGPDNKVFAQQDICIVDNLIEKPDISKFSSKNTYYVDANGNITGRIDTTEPPINWYNYNNKEWANVVTINDNIISYWVWIPRYEYKEKFASKKTDVKFIKKKQTKADEGYEIPESFKFGEKDLSGFWVNKYKLSIYNDTNPKRLDTELKENSIIIKSFENNDTNRYRIFVDGIEYKGNPEEENHLLPYEIQGLASGNVYDILIVDAQTKQPVLEKTIERRVNNIQAPDISDFEESCTFYVTWDENGNKIETPITNSAPQDWYDYEKKKWANIVTRGNNSESYWVWIPRYEYKTYNQTGKTVVKFIPVTQTEPDEGYEIPESFNFGGKELGGFWMSKYKLSK